MRKAYINASQVVTVDSKGAGYKRGTDMKNIGVLQGFDVIVENGTIADFVPSGSSLLHVDQRIDIKNKVLLPGLIDCHTHTVFAGSRASEFAEKLKGISYEEIANRGGGITSTMNVTKNASKEYLLKLSRDRVQFFISQGITSLEIKSGYGPDFETELKILEVINQLNSEFLIDIIPTFLGAHTLPEKFRNAREQYLELLIGTMLPHVAQERLAKFCDVFCEASAFTSKEAERVFSAAEKLGFKLKLHTEQFNNIGGFETGLRHNVTSLDHLEMLTAAQQAQLSGKDSVCVLLPGVSFFLDYNYAPAHSLVDNNAIVALSTDFNPGSSHIPNITLIMQLAARKMHMTIEEIISAVTINAAKAIDHASVAGSLEIGKQADFAIFNTTNYEDIIYTMGKNLLDITVKKGDIIYKSNGV
jgi:imidazolonepropionase